ncbi:hypothetical protein AB0B28_18005 [Glycomyces sp. NPDC046736]|uniref:hypothetical protein n=1 Tax=Glycomyces sp. NPDC046736 TaxID=3155615 RepID=UPI0033D1486F
MRFIDDATVPEFLAGPGLRLMVLGSAEDLSSQVFGRQLSEFDQLTGTRLAIGVVEVARSPETASAWGVQGDLPVQILFQNGVMQQVLRGVRSPKGMWQAMSDYLDAPHI